MKNRKLATFGMVFQYKTQDLHFESGVAPRGKFLAKSVCLTKLPLSDGLFEKNIKKIPSLQMCCLAGKTF